MSQKGGGRYLDVTTKEVANVRLAYVPTPFIHELLLIIIIIIINGGILSLTDSHHHHHDQNPTMVGICHGGNVLGNHDDYDDVDKDKNVTNIRITSRSSGTTGSSNQRTSYFSIDLEKI